MRKTAGLFVVMNLFKDEKPSRRKTTNRHRKHLASPISPTSCIRDQRRRRTVGAGFSYISKAAYRHRSAAMAAICGCICSKTSKEHQALISKIRFIIGFSSL